MKNRGRGLCKKANELRQLFDSDILVILRAPGDNFFLGYQSKPGLLDQFSTLRPPNDAISGPDNFDTVLERGNSGMFNNHPSFTSSRSPSSDCTIRSCPTPTDSNDRELQGILGSSASPLSSSSLSSSSLSSSSLSSSLPSSSIPISHADQIDGKQTSVSSAPLQMQRARALKALVEACFG